MTKYGKTYEFDEDHDFTIDVSCAYHVTSEELQKKYKGFMKLSDDEEIYKAIEYVEKYIFKVEDLHFDGADVN